MMHLPILPILLPALTGILMLLPPLNRNLAAQRYLSWFSFTLLLLLSLVLLRQSDHQAMVYILGGWQPPFGIMLLADRLATMLVALTALLALAASIYAKGHDESSGNFFYPLFMFQVMGINGAFLTGDIFNLFVFFEVLLIASYALLIHGGGKAKTQASFHYITVNLLGSAFFLFALGTLYGTLGTLNMADMSVRVAQLPAQEQAIAKAGGLLLLLVFGLKSAMLPLQFWLPRTYAAAAAPVAALFAIMTKVGLYSIYRVFGGIFGETAGGLAHIATPWIWPLALATIVIGMFGVLAAPSLRILTANIVLVSVGTLLLTFVIDNGQSLAVGLYYLVHSTIVAAALFLIADQIQLQRGNAQDRFVVSRPMRQSGLLGAFYFIAAIGAIGLPPLSGFVGKALVLQSAISAGEQMWVWPALLISSLFALIAFSRAGTSLFWHLSGNKPGPEKASSHQIFAIILLLSALPLMTIFAGPMTTFTERAYEDIHRSNQLIVEIIEQPVTSGGQADEQH